MEIAKAFDVFLELRPHLINKESFVSQVMNQQKEGYEIISITENEEIVAAIVFRFLTTLAWGKIIYIDDLITKEKLVARAMVKFFYNMLFSSQKKIHVMKSIWTQVIQNILHTSFT